MKYQIGKAIAVLGDVIQVLLEDHRRDAAVERGVPADMIIRLPGEPAAVLIGQPGSFIAIDIPIGTLLCMVTAIRMADALDATANGHAETAAGAATGKRVLEVLALGTVNTQGVFERGADVLPTVGAAVHAVGADLLKTIYAGYAQERFVLGKLSLLPTEEAKINFDTFLSRHLAIVGTTGAGKSWTVASILQQVAKFPKSSVVLLDLHGEYGAAFGEYANYVSAQDLELPYWMMTAEELIDVCIDRSEPAAPNVIAKFKEELQLARESHRENAALDIPRISVDTPVYFNFKQMMEEFQRLDTETVLVNLAPKPGPFYGHFTRILLRLTARLNDKRFDLIFNPKQYKSSASMETLFRRLLGEAQPAKKLTVLDLSQVPFEVRSCVISLVLRCLFDFCYWYKRQHGTPYPAAVFCDEAHTYFNELEANRPSRLAAERIAKEGRKYGLSLAVITQRPRELSSTLLSQCNSFLCLRITNPDDQAYVKNLLPDSMRGIVNVFSTLRRGEAILLGDAVIMPTRIRIDVPHPTPNSSDVSFTGNWSQTRPPIDVGQVVDLWRKQGG